MATLLGSLLISLGLDSGKFRTGMTEAEKATVKFQKQMERTAGAMKDLGARMTLGITAPLAAFGAFSVNAASDAAELQSAFDQTFGSLSKSMTQWAQDTGDAMGRSTQEIQNAANTFGIFFNQAAPTKQAAADLSKQFAILAQDLSSFFNVDPQEAMQKIRSGLAGESEPLRDFGVFLTEATVKAKAMEMGLAKTEKAITEQNKVMARAALIMEATTTAQGDVARTADGTANRIRAAKAAFEELQVAIGEKLIPAVRPLIEILMNLLNGFSSLPGPVQTTIVVLASIAAAVGPLVYLAGSLTASFVILGGAFTTTGVAAAGATPGVLLLKGALTGLLRIGGPLVIGLGLLAGAVYLFSRRSDEAAQASATLQHEQETLERVQLKVKNVTEQLAVATGRARQEALANAKALREETKQYLAQARAAAQAARAKLAAVRAKNVEDLQTASQTVIGAGSGYDPVSTQGKINQKRAAAARKEIMDLEKVAAGHAAKLYELEQAIAAPPPEVAQVAPAGGGKPKKGPKSTGRTAAEIAADFADEQLRLEMEALQARERLANSTEERADLQMEMLGLEREQRLAEIEASDFTKEQKDALREQIATLYGTAAAQSEQGDIIVEANEGLIAQAIKRDDMAEMEARAADAMRDQFDLRRDHLQIDLELADTQEERKAIAADILRLEQEYRRNQLEMTLASKVSSDAEKERAAAILASLDALEKREAKAGDKANRTEVERYLDDLDMSVGEVNEAIDGIKIDGLEALNDGIVDAIMGVKSLGEVFKNVAKQIIADLVRIAIRKAIIAPLANMLFPGSGGGVGGGAVADLFSGFNPSTLGLDGARAKGGPVLAGGSYLVGEEGPEIFSPGASGRIIPNHELAKANSSRSIVEIVDTTGLFRFAVDGQIMEAAPGIAKAGAQGALRMASRRQSRRVG